MKRGRIVLGREDYKNLVQAVMHRDHWKCRVCKSRTGLHGHHIVYRSHGGDDADWNLLTLCYRCHEAIHSRHLVILPTEPGEDMDANGSVKFYFLAGWRPGKVKVA